MKEIRQPCIACEGSGHLMVVNWTGLTEGYRAHPKLPCTVCKGYGYMRPVSNEPPPVQLTLTQPGDGK